MADIARKYRRALRNGTGLSLTAEQARALAEIGALDIVTEAENQELCPVKPARASTATSGSTSVAMARQPASTRSRGTIPALDRSAIAQLAQPI